MFSVVLPWLVGGRAVTMVELEQKEKEEERKENKESDCFFAVLDKFIPIPHEEEKKNIANSRQPDRVGIVWDTSLSRTEGSLKNEIIVLEKILNSLSDTTEVQLTFFNHNTLEVVPPRLAGKSLDQGDGVEGLNGRSEIIAAVTDCKYKGATNLGCLKLDGSVSWWILFTDGVATIGPEVSVPPSPCYILTSATISNTAKLKSMAKKQWRVLF